MAKNFSELRAKMSPESQDKIEVMTGVMLAEILLHKNEGLSQTILNWRTQLDVDCASTEPELEKLRAGGQGQEFSWDELIYTIDDCL